MSKISLKSSSSGTATFTIESPATNTDRVLTIPDAAGTVFVGGQALSATTGSFSGNVTLGSSVLETPTGSAPAYLCRAWVNFAGTNTSIRASGNVSSITRHSAGQYTINMTTAMPDANYAVTGTCSEDEAGSRSVSLGFDSLTLTPTTTAFRINTRNFVGNGTNVDCPRVFVSVFR